MPSPNKRPASTSRNTPENKPSPVVVEAKEPVESSDQTPSAIPDDLIAARAYEIWQRRGCPMGHESEQDWHAARAELERERLGWTQAEPADRNKI